MTPIFLKRLQHHIEWTTKRRDEAQVTLLKILHVRVVAGVGFKSFLPTYDAAMIRQKISSGMYALVSSRGDRLRDVVAGQESQQVADQKNGIVSEAVRKFFDSFADFAIFEVAETSIEVAISFCALFIRYRDLFRRETDPPEHALISFAGESFVKNAQAVAFLKLFRFFFYA
jgi:hypothetical protein